MFWEAYYSLCLKIKKSPNAVAKEMGCSSGAVTSWKQGKVPHHKTLLKIAGYFDVSVDSLLGETKKASGTSWRGVEMSEERVKVMDMIASLSDEDAVKIEKVLEAVLGAEK
jgi:transcriptional regulator with XRE-family HTH domain